jgi:hypothetical protein
MAADTVRQCTAWRRSDLNGGRVEVWPDRAVEAAQTATAQLSRTRAFRSRSDTGVARTGAVRARPLCPRALRQAVSPTTANLGATPGDAVADQWVLLVSPFPFLEIFEN